jgi:hypothetical protein
MKLASFEAIVGALNDAKVRFIVVGALPVNSEAPRRATAIARNSWKKLSWRSTSSAPKSVVNWPRCLTQSRTMIGIGK